MKFMSVHSSKAGAFASMLVTCVERRTAGSWYLSDEIEP